VPLNWEWRAAREQDAEYELDVDALKTVEERILDLQDEAVVYSGPAWERLDAMLSKEFQKESNIVFSTLDDMELKLARERARVFARLRRRPEEVEAQLQELFRERRVLSGEEEETEE
jgi:hypothetical protein